MNQESEDMKNEEVGGVVVGDDLAVDLLSERRR